MNQNDGMKFHVNITSLLQPMEYMTATSWVYHEDIQMVKMGRVCIQSVGDGITFEEFMQLQA